MTAPSKLDVRNPKLLVVKPADLGDLLFVTPALRALRETYPDAQIDVLAPPSSSPLLRGCPYIDEVLAFDKYSFDEPDDFLRPANWQPLLVLAWQLRRRKYDAVVIPRHLTTLMGTLKFASLAYATGAPYRVGLDNGRGWFLTHRAIDEGFGARHEVEYDLTVVARIGAHTDDTRLWVPRDPDAEAWAEALVGVLARPLLVVHPGSGDYSTARRWPAERFAALIDRWLARHEGTVLLMDASAEVTKRVRETATLPVLDLGGRTTLLQTIALLRRADLFVGNDSGPLHLAAGVGVPALGIYGLTNQDAWGPWGDRTAIVSRTDLACMPCFYRGHRLGLRNGCPDRPCLTQLPTERVLTAMEEVYGQGTEGTKGN